MATAKKALSNKNPRNVRTYKVVDSVYKKALARAKKEKVPLSNSIENWITEYAIGSATSELYASINTGSVIQKPIVTEVPQKERKTKAKPKDTGELDAAD